MPLLALPFPQIDPVALQLGPLAIRWYALAYIAGLVLGWLYVRRVVRRPGWQMTPEIVDDFLFNATLGVIIGGRLGFVLFYNPGYYLQNPLEILMLWEGGMAFHGGLLGVAVACFVTARQHGLSALEVGDAAAVAAPIGLFFGRIANFINGELWGRPTDLPWGMVFPGAGPLPRHPSQLYEAALEGLLLFLVMAWLARGGYDRTQAGRLGGVFLLGYGTARFLVEFVRQYDPQLGLFLGAFTMGQLLSLPMIVLGAWLIARTRTRAAPDGA